MDIRSLLITALVVSILAAAFYQHQDTSNPPPVVDAESNIDYQADVILALQTNEQGVASQVLTAEQLTHYIDDNTDVLNNVALKWRPASGRLIDLMADDASMDYDTQQVTMTNNVLFASIFDGKPVSSTGDDQPIKLFATSLVGDLEQQIITSDQPITVQQGKHSFDAASMRADLMTGEYDFQRVAVVFTPPSRQDTPLF